SKRDHGNLPRLFDFPNESTSYLNPPSKTKSVYTFGLNGTLAWTTPAGELLQVASCIDNRLLGADYKRSIERGFDYYGRGKALEEALNSSQGSGFGFGLSLRMPLEPVERSWLHNRWPRFTFRYNGLDIVLQYIVSDRSIIQEYHIQNTGQAEVTMPYVVSSDLFLREHGGQSTLIPPTPLGKSVRRLLLFENTEVLIQSDIEKCQLKMALFLNSKKQCLWRRPEPSECLENKAGRKSSVYSKENLEEAGERDGRLEIEEAQKRLRSRILAGHLVDEDADSDLRRLYRRYPDRTHTAQQPTSYDVPTFATHKDNLVVPAGSTQQLCLVIHLSGLQHSQSGSLDPQAEPFELTRKIDDGDGQRNTDAEERIRSGESMLEMDTKQVSLRSFNLEGKERLTKIIHDHTDLGLACTTIDWIPEAKYHLIMACFIAEYLYTEGSYGLSNARFEYAKFLSNQGGYSKAIEILEELSRTLTKSLALLRKKVRIRLAKLYLDEVGMFAEAERIYQSALSDPIMEEEVLKPVSAHCLERLAWAQIKQDKYEEAHRSYSRLLDLPKIRRQAILVNLGFIERKLGRIEEAKRLFEEALQSNGSGSAIDQTCAQSGLYACLRKYATSPEDHPEVGPYLVGCQGVMPPLLRSHFHPTTFELPCQGFPLQFTLSRHLESLLSTCSVPINIENDTSGIAFVDADPLSCIHEGRHAYFQFKLLTQFQQHIDKAQYQKEHQQELSNRIKTTCQGHLVWVFKVAKFNGTWATFYSVRDSLDSHALGDRLSTTKVVEGAYNFSKLWLYLSTWETEWEFVLNLLHARLSDWLAYLVQNRHMDNLWVERQDVEELRPYDTISPDPAGTYNVFPQYHLSDFTMLWLAFQQLESLISSLSSNTDLFARKEDDPIKQTFNQVQKAFEEFQALFGSRKTRTNILKTFLIPIQGEHGTQNTSDERAIVQVEANGSSTARTNASIDVSQTEKGLDHFRSLRTTKIAQQILAYRRTVSEYGWIMQSTDIATIEAARAGFFEDPDEHVVHAWQKSLKLQLDQSILSLESPEQVALTLFAAKFGYTLGNAHGADIEKAYDRRKCSRVYALLGRQFFGSLNPNVNLCFSIDSWLCDNSRKDDEPVHKATITNALQYNQSSLHRRKASIEIPQHPGASTKPARRNVVDDAKFLPAWMYHHPIYLHEEPLKIDLEQAFEGIGDFSGFKTAVEKWKTSKEFSKTREDKIFPPHVADSGTKKRAEFDGESIQRRITVGWDATAANFYESLMQPRTFDHGKKRLVELTSHQQEAVLVCWLTAPQRERPMFLEFIRRHGSSESFFGERVDWKGNIWETELHLGFHQLLSEEDNKRFRPPHLDYNSSLRIRKMPTLSQVPTLSDITPCSISLRFVGDLHDRSWTCHLLSSSARDYGFTGLLDEYTDARGGESSPEDLYKVKIGQRKILEMTYVARVLTEMAQSCEEILAGFHRELDVPETRDPQSESYEFIDNYSRLHSKAGEILRDVFQQLALTVRTIEDWEKREDSRGLQSRWSEKDETRHGERLRERSRECQSGIQRLRRIRDRLEEHQKLAEQRHNNLINYMSLQAARTSSQSAEDVRLFTYVTIIFLPLSFSSSLFSMGGAPASNVVSVMVPTTVIALAVTIFVLANMKSLDRNFNFLVYRINASARRKMQQSKHSWGFSWNRKSRELEEFAQLQLKPENDKHLPAQSKWWYFLFWVSHALRIPRLCVLEPYRIWSDRKNTPVNLPGFLIKILLSIFLTPACIFIFAAQLVIVTTIDIGELLWKAVRQLQREMFKAPAIDKSPKKGSKKLSKKSGLDQEDEAETVADDNSEDPDVSREFSKEAPKTTEKLDTTFRKVSDWLQTPPRPIREYTLRKLDLRTIESDGQETHLAESKLDDGPAIINDRMLTEEDKYESAIDQGSAGKDRMIMSRSLSGLLLQRQPSDESYKQKPSVWGRWNTKFSDSQKPESRV
ncbi:MAG: hypothetical protein Q9168_003722, partial [Polycauliona sp. 1 TL-2023]